MSKPLNSEDYVGKIFNYYTILEVFPVVSGTSRKCRVRCKCGTEKVVSFHSVISGGTKSCGCIRGISRRNDLTGQVFGRWVVISISDSRDMDKSVMWNCVCTCGVKKLVNANSLRRGLSTSCGCATREAISKLCLKDETGNRFNNLVVLELLPERGKHKEVRYRCLCDCGKEIVVTGLRLRYGQKSCGCLNAEITRKSNSTHGISHTKVWWNWVNRKRRDMEDTIDVNWTLDMEIAIKDYFKSCVLCSSTSRLCVDHVLPLSKGNELIPGNAIILCRSCNSKKADKDLKDLPLDWQASIIWNALQFKNYWEELQENKPEEIPEPVYTREQLESDLNYWNEV